MTIDYRLSMFIKEFLGDKAPKPISNIYWHKTGMGGLPIVKRYVGFNKRNILCPAYSLEDVLSKSFCKAMWFKIDKEDSEAGANLVFRRLAPEYFEGGLSGVEKAILNMMVDK